MPNRESSVATDLVERARRGGAAEADDLIRAVWPRAYSIAVSIVNDASLAEDAAQEACAILFRSIRRLRSIEAFGVWFYRIVVRQAVAIARWNSRDAMPEPQRGASDLDSSLLRIDVQRALNTLTPAQRIAIALYYYAELNSHEIAATLSMPNSSVRFHIMLAKRSLAQALRNQVEESSVKVSGSGVA
jgi:RNA polymerase sigma-70 factor (ECF subfamily)